MNTGHAPAAAVQVTEIRIPGSQGAPVSGTEERQERGDANLRLRPVENLDLFLEAGVGQTVRDDAGVRVTDEQSYRYTVGTVGSTWRPWGWLSGTVRSTRERFDDPLLLTRDPRQDSSSLEVSPNERITLEFSASRSREDRDREPFITTDALFGHSSVSLVHDMAFSLQASRSHQEEPQAGRRSERDFLLATFYAPLRSNLEMRLDQQVDNLDVREASGATTATEAWMSGIELTWRATPLLTLVADLEYWARAVQQEGLTQRYRVDWLPFPEGQLLVQLDYRRESGGVILTPTEATFLQLRWTLHNNVYLDFTGNWSRRGSISGETQSVRSLLLTLNVEFQARRRRLPRSDRSPPGRPPPPGSGAWRRLPLVRGPGQANRTPVAGARPAVLLERRRGALGEVAVLTPEAEEPIAVQVGLDGRRRDLRVDLQAPPDRSVRATPVDWRRGVRAELLEFAGRLWLSLEGPEPARYEVRAPAHPPAAPAGTGGGAFLEPKGSGRAGRDLPGTAGAGDMDIHSGLADGGRAGLQACLQCHPKSAVHGASHTLVPMRGQDGATACPRGCPWAVGARSSAPPATNPTGAAATASSPVWIRGGSCASSATCRSADRTSAW